MSETKAASGGLTRRNFLKTTGAVAGAAALAGGAGSLAALADDYRETGEDQIEYKCVSCTNNCNGLCGLRVYVRDGKAVNIVPQPYPEDITQGCQKGLSHIPRIYDENRLKYPMRRVGERGSGEFERISWDDAIAEICEKWKGYISEYGGESIVFFPGSGNQRVDCGNGGYIKRLASYLGACVMDTGYDNNGMWTMRDSFGNDLSFIGSDWRDLVNAKHIFVWGGDPSEAAPIRWRWLMDAREGGSKITVIDPNFTIVASKAQEFVPIRPGSDGLLAIGMMQIILEEGLQDEEFLLKQTVAPYLVKESDGMYLRQSSDKTSPILVMDANGSVVPSEQATDPRLEGSFEVDGQNVTTAYSLLLERLKEWDLTTISEYCDIPEERIRELALEYADGPSYILTGYGPDHYANGFTFYSNMCALAMISGNFLKKGAGITGCSFGNYATMGVGNVSSIINPKDGKGTFSLNASYFNELLETGKWGEKEITVKSLYIWAHNPIGNQPDRQLWLENFSKVEFIVIADMYMQESVKYADIVLPVPYYFELESYHTSNTYARLCEQVVPPAFESKGDFEIATLLGQGMGFADKFTMTREDYCEAAFDNATAKKLGITWERLKEEKVIKAGPAEPYLYCQNGINTPTKKAQFYYEGVRPTPDIGQEWDQKRESLPYWEPPHEAWFENEQFKKYPIIFMTERGKYKVHSQYTFVPTLLELDREPYIKMSPDDANERGIKTGDTVRAYNDRGHVVCKAVVNSGNRKGTVTMDHGWQEGQFVDGHYNDLSSIYTAPHFPSGCWFDNLVEIEKVQ